MNKPENTKPGHHYYTKKGLKPVLVYLKPSILLKLKRLAMEEEGGTLQQVLRNAIERFAENRYS